MRNVNRENPRARAISLAYQQKIAALDAARSEFRIRLDGWNLGISTVEAADWKFYDGEACIEALVRIGMIPRPYTLVLSIPQALFAGIIARAERTEVWIVPESDTDGTLDWNAKAAREESECRRSCAEADEAEGWTVPPGWEKYEARVRALEAEGMTRSDAQGIADIEGLAPFGPGSVRKVGA